METPIPERSRTPDGYSSRPTSRGVPESPMPTRPSTADRQRASSAVGLETPDLSDGFSFIPERSRTPEAYASPRRPSTATRSRPEPSSDQPERPATAGRQRSSSSFLDQTPERPATSLGFAQMPALRPADGSR